MKHITSAPRVVGAGLLALGAFALASVLGTTPALAMGLSALRLPGRGLSLPVHGSSGGASWVGVVVLVAIVASAAAFGVSGRRLGRHTATSADPGATGDRSPQQRPVARPSAVRPLPHHAPIDARARHTGGRHGEGL